MIIDCFSGAGGWEEGLKLLGYQALGIELDIHAVRTAQAAGHHVSRQDVAAVSSDWMRQPCEGFIASPPCPSFSVGGKQLGRKDIPAILHLIDELARGHDDRFSIQMHDERSRLTCEPMRWVYHLRPEWVALEQVPAVLPIWEKMAERLQELGYSTWAGKIHAERYGVPQTRQRAILIASRVHEVKEPDPTNRRYYQPNHKRATTPPDMHLPRWVSMAEGLGWGMTHRPSMSVTGGGTYTGGAEVFGNGARKGIHRERLSGRWVDHPDMPTSTIALRSEDWPHHRPATTIAGDSRVFPPGGHHVPGAQSHGAIRVSVQEAAMLQSFRVDYPWQGNKGQQHMQVGNAVPPLMAKAILSEAMGLRSNGRVNLSALGL